MSIKENKKKPLDGFYKDQLANHREVFSKVEPIVTQDGKDQGYQDKVKLNKVKISKENKIRHFITKLFRVANKDNKKVAADKNTELDQNNNLNPKNAIEKRIKQMNSKEVLQFLNTDEIQSSDAKDKSNVRANIEEQIKNMDSKQILQFLNTDNLLGKTTNQANVVETKGKIIAENKEAVSWVSAIKQSNSNKERGI